MSNHELKHEHKSGEKTLTAYIIGFALSLILTLISFKLVEKKIISDYFLYINLAGLALIQFFVQSVCFLGLNNSKDGKWNLFPYLLTLLIIAILVGGTLWIMYNLNFNMMN